MKGISMLLTVVLLLLAHELAIYLKKSGNLPAARELDRLSLQQTDHSHDQTPTPIRI